MDEKIILAKQEKKSVRKLINFIMIPFIMIFVYDAFAGLYLSVFGDALTYGGLKNENVYWKGNNHQDE